MCATKHEKKQSREMPWNRILFAVGGDIYEGFNVLTAVVDVMLTASVSASVPLYLQFCQIHLLIVYARERTRAQTRADWKQKHKRILEFYLHKIWNTYRVLCRNGTALLPRQLIIWICILTSEGWVAGSIISLPNLSTLRFQSRCHGQRISGAATPSYHFLLTNYELIYYLRQRISVFWYGLCWKYNSLHKSPVNR